MTMEFFGNWLEFGILVLTIVGAIIRMEVRVARADLRLQHLEEAMLREQALIERLEKTLTDLRDIVNRLGVIVESRISK